MHQQISEGERICARADWEEALKVTRAVGKMLQHFPTITATQAGERLKRTPGQRRRTPRRPEPEPLAPELRHLFRKQGRSFYCRRCFSTAFSPATAAARAQTQACGGDHPGLRRLVESAQELEHSLLLAVWQGKPTLICQRCGAMASSDLPSGLKMPCLGNPANGRARDGVWRAEKGLHPHQRNQGPLEALLKVDGNDLYPLEPQG